MPGGAVPAAALSALDPSVALAAVEAAADAGELLELLVQAQPALHTTELPLDLTSPVCTFSCAFVCGFL